jgi:uncharacterized surface protein with fasciclin (FAS1) repeats
VFAPTDDAFGKLPDGIVNALIKPENKDLHFDLPCSCWKNYVDRFIRWYESHNGERRSNGSFKRRKGLYNDAEVVLADVETDNGIIHAVNKVITAHKW